MIVEKTEVEQRRSTRKERKENEIDMHEDAKSSSLRRGLKGSTRGFAGRYGGMQGFGEG
jgi:hypothetical protein